MNIAIMDITTMESAAMDPATMDLAVIYSTTMEPQNGLHNIMPAK